MAITQLDVPATTSGGCWDMYWKTVYSDRVLVQDRYRVTLFEEREWESGYKMASSIRITSCLEVIDLAEDRRNMISRHISDSFDENRFDAHFGMKVEDVSVNGSEVTVTTSWGVQRKTLIVSLSDSGAG